MKDGKIILNVLRVEQRIGVFYIASISAHDLVHISYADVRRLATEQRDVEKYLGIQRPISRHRIAEIREYISAPDATFPTAVILAIDERCVTVEPVDESCGTMTLQAFVPKTADEGEEIPLGKIAKILDGQHRIAGFLDEKNQWMFNESIKAFFFNIAIFVGADISQQANIFATVNLAQTKVNKSLVYDLSELAKTESPYKTCHNVAVALDREETSPFYKRIKRLSTATPGRRAEPLTQAAFVESLIPFISTQPAKDRNLLFEGKRLPLATADELKKTPFRNLFIQGREVDITEILYNYFDAIRSKWPHSWGAYEVTGNLLPRSNAFKAFMKYLLEDVYADAVGKEFGTIPTAEEFGLYFDELNVEDDDFTTRNFVPGSSGQAMFLKLLRREVTLEDMLQNSATGNR